MRSSKSAAGTTSLTKRWRSRPGDVAQRAGEQQLARGGLAQDLGQQQRAGVRGDEADADLGRREARAVGGDAQVAAGGELERAADADAVDRGEHRHGRGERDARQALEARRSWPPTPPASASSAAKRSSPAEKCSPAPRDDDAAHALVGAGRLDARRRSPRSSSRVQALRCAWRSQLTTRARAELARRSTVMVPPRCRLMASGSCVASRGPVHDARSSARPPAASPGASGVDREARAQRGVQRRVDPSTPSPSRRRRAAAGRSGRRRRPPRSGRAPSKRPSTAPIALRVDVDRLHAQHVVEAAVDADARRAAPAGARRRPHASEVARAVAQQRRGLAAQVGPDELAVGAVLERAAASPVSGLDELEDRLAVGGQVQPLARLALAGHGRPHVAHAEVSATEAPQVRLDLRAHRAEAGARLARGDDVAQAERRAGRAPPRARARRGGRGRRASRRSR